MDNTTSSTVDRPVMAGETDQELAEQLVERARAEGLELTGPNGLLTGLTRRVIETALESELTDHVGYEPGDPAGRGSGNSRNGRTTKKVHTEVGQVEIAVPRDRNGTFEPQLIPKHSRRLEGFNEAIVSLYARGMTTGDIQGHLRQLYGAEVSRELISKITDAVVEEMAEWQSRPLDAVYPVMLIDAIFVKIRDGSVANRPIYVAMGINVDGQRDVLGMWVGPSGGEGAKVWMGMLTELRNRGAHDVCIVCCDGLKGLPEAITATWPQATVQTCVVHLVRNSLRYASKADWGAVTKDMKAIYTAPSVDAAETVMLEFSARWAAKYPAMVAAWERAWPEFVPFLAFPVEIRKLIYTTNAIESLNARFRRAVRRRGHFPNDQAALKVLYLTIREKVPNKTNPVGQVNGWKSILNALTIHYGDRLAVH
jgi:transposase-like protein